MTHLVQEVLGHEDGQDGIHPVIRKALGRFVADDVRNAGWHRTDLRRRGEVLVVSHNESLQCVGVLSGKNSTGVGDAVAVGDVASSLIAPEVSSLPPATSTCSFCASGSSPRRCFSHEQQKIRAAVEMAAAASRTPKCITRRKLIGPACLAQDESVDEAIFLFLSVLISIFVS